MDETNSIPPREFESASTLESDEGKYEKYNRNRIRNHALLALFLMTIAQFCLNRALFSCISRLYFWYDFEPWEGISCLRDIYLLEKPDKAMEISTIDMDLNMKAPKRLIEKIIMDHVHQTNHVAK